jgi:hypothetical protein
VRLVPSDPDVQTLVARIERGDIDLQPNFQRGEVWSRLKKQKLIDSILRDWHVPPIHVIENKLTGRQEVLDGQQRLAAIRDFVDDEFPIDGKIEPQDESIEALDGLRYSELDEFWRRRLNQFAIRVFRLIEYEPGEPWELFFRLNQTTRLTGAEERNAFFGPVRNQIKAAVSNLADRGINERILGFSNARMAYDDVLSRTALAVQRGTLTEKITANDLTGLYRSTVPLPTETMDRLESATAKLAVFSKFPPARLKLNKATVFTWLMFFIRASWYRPDAISDMQLARFIEFFLFVRNTTSHSSHSTSSERLNPWLFYVLEDRSTARVADTSSVILRDAIVWNLFLEFAKMENASLPLSSSRRQLLISVFDNLHNYDDDELSRNLLQSRWGDLP